MKNIVPQPLSSRAKHRLRIAAGLLRNGGTLKLSREHFYDEMLAHVNGLSRKEQDDLKDLVDWVEDYERAAPPASNLKLITKAKPAKKTS